MKNKRIPCDQSINTEPSIPPRVLVDLHGGQCNLKCPKCLVHGVQKPKDSMQKLRGQMPLDKALQILQEIEPAKPLVQPCLWSEPLMARHFRDHLIQIRSFELPISINTNGLLLDQTMANFIVNVGVTSVFVSIDATTPEVLAQVRGTYKLDEIEGAVFRVLGARGESRFPRVGVSFTVEEANSHEVDGFIKKWIRYVDVIRVNQCWNFSDQRQSDFCLPPRIPCGSLYETMPIHFNGNVSICCQDGFQQTNMGNVFEEGIEAVWHGARFSQVRQLHENGEYDKVPFCKNCTIWALSLYEEITDLSNNLLIRRSPLVTYYNRLDSMDNFVRTTSHDFD